MKPKYDLVKDDVKSLFFHYLLPSISATLVTSIYVLADTIIIGKGIGETAVAALNLVLPLFTVFFGTGLLFGVGGSIQMTLQRANQNENEGRSYFTTAVLANLGMMLFYLLISIFCFDSIASFLGASESTFGYVKEYGRWLIAGIPFFMFSSFLQAFVRNDHAPRLAMIAVVTGGIMNIILDYIFVFPMSMGMTGAALATFLGSLITCSILIAHFFSKNNGLKLYFHKLNLTKLGHIFTNGFSSFLIEMASGILTFIFNIQLLRYIGDLGVTVYSIIANTAIIVMSLSNGVAQASQPIITMNYGVGNLDRIKKVKRLGLITSSFVGAFFTIFGLLLPKEIVYLFIHPTSDIMKIAPNAIRIYFVSFVFCTINMFLSNYCQSTVKPLLAMLICMLRGFILSTALLFVFPAIFGATAIWYVMPVVEVITLLVSAFAIHYKESMKNQS